MSNFVLATVQFPLGRLAPSFLSMYRGRYADPDTGWTFEFQDKTDDPASRRSGSLSNGSIVPIPVYDEEPDSDATPKWRAEHQIGSSIAGYWPPQFLADAQRDPQPEPELFDGIIISE